MTRRELILSLLAVACSRTDKTRNAQTASAQPAASSGPVEASTCAAPELYEWTLEGISTRAAILAPPQPKLSERFPVLVALHGRGEAVKGPARGALGWANDYALRRVLTRLCAPPLTSDDFEGLVTEEHLAEINQDLAARPWEGLIVACPYLPDLDLRRDTDVRDYGRFIASVLLPRIGRELPAVTHVGSTGIDGVSLGGAVALRAGLGAPETFGAVGALQPAIDDARVSDLVDLARAARAKRAVSLRITTSHDDVYRDVTHALSNAWRAAGIDHEFSELPGPHDYIFNRGAGAYEMVVWHRRTLGRAG